MTSGNPSFTLITTDDHVPPSFATVSQTPPSSTAYPSQGGKGGVKPISSPSADSASEKSRGVIIGLVVLLILLIIAFAILAYIALRNSQVNLNAALNALTTSTGQIVSIVLATVNLIISLINSIIAFIEHVVSEIINDLQSLGNTLVGFVLSIYNSIAGLLGPFIAQFPAAVGAIETAVVNFWNASYAIIEATISAGMCQIRKAVNPGDTCT